MMHYLAPVLPLAAQAVFDKLHTAPVVTKLLNKDFYNLTPGTPITVGDILFTKIEQGEQPVVVEKAPKAKPAAKKPEPVVEDPNQSAYSKMDIRVGRIVRVWNHETADRLFCEEIDVGEDVPRCVASGLREHYSLEDMENRLVSVVCNLKEVKIQGFVSSGMVLAAKFSDADGKTTVQLLDPPAGSVVGERITAANCPGAALPSARIKKLKVWEEVVPELRLNEEGLACWQSHLLATSAGHLTTKSLKNAPLG